MLTDRKLYVLLENLIPPRDARGVCPVKLSRAIAVGAPPVHSLNSTRVSIIFRCCPLRAAHLRSADERLGGPLAGPNWRFALGSSAPGHWIDCSEQSIHSRSEGRLK